MPTSSKSHIFHYSPTANRFVGDAEPYGFAVNLCVYGCNILPVCLSILRHGSAVPPPFLRRPTKQLPVAWAPLAKELPVGLRIDNIIKYSRFTDSRKGCPYGFLMISPVSRNAEDGVPYKKIICSTDSA